MMSNISVLSIKKDRLIKHRYRGENIVERDVSKYLVQCLPNYCHIEEGTTLGDIFRLISPHRHVLSEIFHSFYFDEYMEEAEGLINQRSEKYDDSDLLVVRVISDKTYNNYEYPHELCGIDDIVTDIYTEILTKELEKNIHAKVFFQIKTEIELQGDSEIYMPQNLIHPREIIFINNNKDHEKIHTPYLSNEEISMMVRHSFIRQEEYVTDKIDNGICC